MSSVGPRIPVAGLPAALAVVRLARRRVELLSRQFSGSSPAHLLALARAEIRKIEPVLARAITDAIVLAWLRAARITVRDAGAPVVRPAEVGTSTPFPGGPDNESTAESTTPTAPDHWPVIRAAVSDLMSREVLTPERYDRLSSEAKSAAFSVARVLSVNAQEQVRHAIARHVRQGGTLRGFRAEVAEALADSGLSDSQVETVYRTQVGQAHAAGLRTVLDHPAVQPEFPYVAYHAVHDSRTGDHDQRFELPTHMMMEQLGLNGTNVYRADDPVIRKFWPPWRWNCRCAVIPISIEDAAAAGVQEARVWLRNGVPPAVPGYVAHPPFDLPKGWPRASDGGIKSVV